MAHIACTSLTWSRITFSRAWDSASCISWSSANSDTCTSSEREALVRSDWVFWVRSEVTEEEIMNGMWQIVFVDKKLMAVRRWHMIRRLILMVWQDFSISIDKALEILQSCADSLIFEYWGVLLQIQWIQHTGDLGKITEILKFCR